MGDELTRWHMVPDDGGDASMEIVDDGEYVLYTNAEELLTGLRKGLDDCLAALKATFNTEYDMRLKLDKAESERDEARAEVERLRGLLRRWLEDPGGLTERDQIADRQLVADTRAALAEEEVGGHD